MVKNILALKPYLETIRAHCAGLPQSDLIDLLCLAAQDVAAEERFAFLEKLTRSSAKIRVQQMPEEQDDDILTRTEKLLNDVAAWQKSVEDGSYYENNCDEDEYYDDEEFPSISKEQQETLEALFAEADKLFLAGKLDLAGKAYQQLIELALHGAELDYWIDYNDLDIIWRETLARYCRCVYETTSGEEQAKQFLFAMEAERRVFTESYEPAAEIFPSLRDVFDARPAEPAGWNNFLNILKKKLNQRSGNRAGLLHLEAVLWTDGITKLAAEVRRKKMPVGYLYWLDQLRESEAWDELAQAAQEALTAMPADRLRVYAAAQLNVAGEKTGDSRLAVQGKREQFFSEPQEKHLAALLREAARHQSSEVELSKALAFLADAQSEDKQALSLLRIKIMLLQGNLREAYAEIDRDAAFGWSNDQQTAGAVYASILLFLSNGNAEAKTIHGLFDRYLRGRYGEYFIRDEIKKRLLQLSVISSQRQNWLEFIGRISSARAEHIISNKYRKGYARAAEALGGYMECLLLHEQKSKAAEFLDLKRNQHYKRYPAFRRELDEVVTSSPLLASL